MTENLAGIGGSINGKGTCFDDDDSVSTRVAHKLRCQALGYTQPATSISKVAESFIVWDQRFREAQI